MVKNVKETLKKKWDSLSPEVKKKIVIFIALGVLIFSITGLILSKKENNQNNQVEVVRKNEQTENIDVDLLKKAQYYETKKMIEELRKNNEELQKEIENLKRQKEELEKKITEAKESKEISSIPLPPPERGGTSEEAVLPPPVPSSSTCSIESEAGKENVKPVKEEVLSGIGIVSEKVEVKKKGGKQEDKSKKGKKMSYYLPPSFMQATLLSGLDAPAVSKGRGNPVPVLLRIKAPAVLPNEVKANLKGCFIIAEGLGNLASERADLRLVSLSCIDKKGRAVIDQKVKGFIVDTDGKIGLRGRVVSKMGSVLARALLAGFVSGIGQAFGYRSFTYTYSPEGTLALPKTSEALSAGIAGGVQQAANELMRFYMELARQTIPVVEVLPTRTVTVVISEGVELKLKNI